MCQAIPYQAMKFLGDRGAVLYDLHAATLVWNGSADDVVSIAKTGANSFEDLRTRARALHGSDVFDFGFTPGGGARPYFVTRAGGLWLGKRLGFPHSAGGGGREKAGDAYCGMGGEERRLQRAAVCHGVARGRDAGAGDGRAGGSARSVERVAGRRLAARQGEVRVRDVGEGGAGEGEVSGFRATPFFGVEAQHAAGDSPRGRVAGLPNRLTSFWVRSPRSGPGHCRS